MFEENTIIGKIAKGEYPEETVDTKYGEFIVKFPSGLDFQVISRKTAACYGGFPIVSFSVGVQRTNEVDMTLSEVITSYPEKFPGKWKKEGIVDFPDWEVKNALYEAFNTFFTDTQKRITGKSGDKSSV